MGSALGRTWPSGALLVVPLLAVVLLACGGSDISGPTARHPNFITGGVPTGASFGSVGAHLMDIDGDGTIEALSCSGSLIAPRVFLLAAHCVTESGAGGECFFPGLPAAQHYVTFVPALFPNFPPPGAIQAEECHADPEFINGRRPQSNTHDIAVLILPAGSTAGMTPYQLPPAGLLDQLAAHGGLRDQLFVNVGYGVDAKQTGRPAIAFDSFDGVRRASKSPLQALKPNVLALLDNSRATGEGGICFIDSGSPHFLESNLGMAVAITVEVDSHCRTMSWNYRLDTPSARAFLGQFMSLP